MNNNRGKEIARTSKSLPPYGREVLQILQSPDTLKRFSGCTKQRATIWIATGLDAWEWRFERPAHLAVVLPYDADPAEFKWSFIHRHEPALLIGPDSENEKRRQQIAAAMFRDGVTAVLAGRVLMQTSDHQTGIEV
jgi:hypothetical protein